MRLVLKPRLALAGCSLAAIAILTLMIGPERAVAQDPGLAKRVEGILKSRCFKCHGQSGPAARDVYVLDRESLVDRTHVVVPKDPNSKLLRLVEVGGMPPGGPKLPPAEIKALRDWVLAGAPVAGGPAATAPTVGTGAPESPSLHAGDRRRTEFIDELQVLRSIQEDQQKQADELTRRNYRYYSIVHLYNNADYSDEEINAFRLGLSKLVNSLSWNPRIHPPVPIDPNKLILRIDLRDYNWTPAIWKRIIASYPYGVVYRDTEVLANSIAVNSGADPATFVPYIRADWFVDHACLPPLYNDVLELPKTVTDLEKLLQVDVKRNVDQQHDVLRAGMRSSGVSHNNRVVERHVSPFGAYWKSHDFASNSSAAKKNVFADPLQFVEDGGEFIWNLPNGMQAYMIANKDGERIDAAPIAIVKDGTNPVDPTVRTGRSCMGCHIQGMREARDQIRDSIQTMLNPGFDVDAALALYKPQGVVNQAIKEDTDRFRNAVQASGGQLPAVPEIEPITALANKYEQELTVTDAAAEVGMKVKEFQAVLSRAQNLVEKLGYAQLLSREGGIKRDLWEENFATLIKEMRLSRGTVRVQQPDQPIAAAQPPADNRKSVAVGDLQADKSDPKAQELKEELGKDLKFFLSQSRDLKVVEGKADVELKGRVVIKQHPGEPPQAIVSVGDARTGTQQEVVGRPDEGPFLAQQLANKVNFDVTRNWLPVPSAQDPRLKTDEREIVQRADPLQQLEPPPAPPVRPVAGGPPAPPEKLIVSLDQGPDATYFVGDKLQVRLRGDRDCFVWIYNRDTNGNMTRIYPNQLTKGPNRMRPGAIFTFPERDAEYEWEIQPADPREGRGDGLGLETILAIATLDGANPLPQVPEAPIFGDGPRGGAKPIAIGAKPIVLAVKQKQQAGEIYAQTQVRFQTTSRSPRDLPR